MKIAFINPADPLDDAFSNIWTNGCHGSEEWQIVTAQALSERGHHVTIYGQFRRARMFDKIHLRPLPDLEGASIENVVWFNARCADAPWAPWRIKEREILNLAESLGDRVVCFSYRPMVPAPPTWNPRWFYLAFSLWHAEYQKAVGVPESRIRVVRLPVAKQNDFTPDYPRAQSPVCLFASSPDRGLDNVLKIWPRIRAAVPKATLAVTYVSDMQAQSEEFLRAGIYWLGERTFDQMKKAYHRAHVLLYPANDDVETFCYSAAKAQLAGCVPVVYNRGALAEAVVPDGGYVLDRDDEDGFIDAVTDLLLIPDHWGNRSRVCSELKPTRPEDMASRLEAMFKTFEFAEVA